ARFFTQLLDRTRALPGVRSAGVSSRIPLMLNGMNQNPFYPENDPSYATKIPPLQIYTTTDGEYFRTMGIPLIAGKTFDRLDSQQGYESIISQATSVRFFKDSSGQRALGKRFRSLPGGPLYTIIGVVGNARDTALAAPPSETVYFPEVVTGGSYNDQTRNTMALVVRTACAAPQGCAMDGITASVRRVVRELDPSLPLFDVRSMSAVFQA